MDIDLENTREAIALLMAAAAQIEDVSAPEPESEPAGDINDLIERQKQLQEQLAVLKRRESELMREMQSIRDEVAAVERQQSSIKERAAAQFEILFGSDSGDGSEPPHRGADWFCQS